MNVDSLKVQEARDAFYGHWLPDGSYLRGEEFNEELSALIEAVRQEERERAAQIVMPSPDESQEMSLEEFTKRARCVNRIKIEGWGDDG